MQSYKNLKRISSYLKLINILERIQKIKFYNEKLIDILITQKNYQKLINNLSLILRIKECELNTKKIIKYSYNFIDADFYDIYNDYLINIYEYTKEEMIDYFSKNRIISTSINSFGKEVKEKAVSLYNELNNKIFIPKEGIKIPIMKASEYIINHFNNF